MAATIGDVAERAHVSTATVSRVLAGVGRARPETEARVLAAARELDYRPSGVARSLKRQTTETLGLIVTDIENPYFPELVRAVEDAARAEGYAILLCNAADDPEREAGYLELLVERRVDGLIIAASSLGAPPRRVARGARHFPWSWSTPPPPMSTCRRSIPTTAPGAGSRPQHLLDLGHRRFGYLMPPPRNVDGPVRLAGVRDALAEAGLDPASIAIATGAPLVGGGEAAMLELLDRAPDVTAVLAYNDLMAIGALRAVRRRGGSVPDDVSVVGFDDVALAAYVDPPLTTLSQSTAEMGYWAVARLAERLRPRASGGGAPTRQARGPAFGADRDAPGPARGPRLDRTASARLVGQGASTAPTWLTSVGITARRIRSRARRTRTAARSGTPPRPGPSTTSDPAAAAKRRSSRWRVRVRPTTAGRRIDAWSAARNVSPAPVGSLSPSVAVGR